MFFDISIFLRKGIPLATNMFKVDFEVTLKSTLNQLQNMFEVL